MGGTKEISECGALLNQLHASSEMNMNLSHSCYLMVVIVFDLRFYSLFHFCSICVCVTQ